LTYLIAGVISCANLPTGPDINYGISSDGTIKKQGITTYQYGTHILADSNGKTIYALKSDTIELDDYMNKKVRVKGELVNGYPVDGGPNYLDVKRIE
jgi:hypothetical protein